MKNQNPSQQSRDRSKGTKDRMEQRRQALRRKTKRLSARAAHFAETVALKSAATSLRAARMVVQRVAEVDEPSRRKRISVED